MFVVTGIKRVLFLTGRLVRETGQALDRVGCAIQGNMAYRETLSRHRCLMPLYDRRPVLSQGVFVAPSSTLSGSVNVGEDASVWYGAVLRADTQSIIVGARAVIGDRASILVGSGPHPTPTLIGHDAWVAPGSVLESCVIEDGAFVGMGSVVQRGSVLGTEAILLPGSVLPPGLAIPAGEVWGGSPVAAFVRAANAEDRQKIAEERQSLVNLAKVHDAVHQRTALDEEKLKNLVYDMNAHEYHDVPEHLA